MSQWMIPANRLDDDQKQFMFEEIDSSKNVFLQGLPGTGKSILLAQSIDFKLYDEVDASICIVVFTHSLIEMFKSGLNDLYVSHKNFEIKTYFQFKKENKKYDFIFCDEVQDLPTSILKLMKDRSRKLIVAGDANQSLYAYDPQTREPVVQTSNIDNIIDSSAYTLNTIYRFPKSIAIAIDNLLPKLNIKSADLSQLSKNVSIRLAKGVNEIEEVNYILNRGKDAIESEQSVVILLPTHKDILRFSEMIFSIYIQKIDNIPLQNNNKIDYYPFNEFCKKNNIPIEYLGNGYGNLYESDKKGRILLMTYHSVKGLEFDNVFLAFLSNDFRNLYIEHENREEYLKTLFMVGMTRTKNNLYLSYSDNLPSYVNVFKDRCVFIEIAKENSSIEEDDIFEFNF